MKEIPQGTHSQLFFASFTVPYILSEGIEYDPLSTHLYGISTIHALSGFKSSASLQKLEFCFTNGNGKALYSIECSIHSKDHFKTYFRSVK